MEKEKKHYLNQLTKKRNKYYILFVIIFISLMASPIYLNLIEMAKITFIIAAITIWTIGFTLAFIFLKRAEYFGTKIKNIILKADGHEKTK